MAFESKFGHSPREFLLGESNQVRKNPREITMTMTRTTVIDCWIEANSEAVVAAIAVKHPLMYDVHNLCEMAYENKISSFKVKMLREICKHFEISFNTRDTKSA